MTENHIYNDFRFPEVQRKERPKERPFLTLDGVTESRDRDRIKASYRTLADAVILRAVEDYRKAEDEAAVEELEDFFRSEWFSILTELDPETIIRRLREEKENEREEYEEYEEYDKYDKYDEYEEYEEYEGYKGISFTGEIY